MLSCLQGTDPPPLGWNEASLESRAESKQERNREKRGKGKKNKGREKGEVCTKY